MKEHGTGPSGRALKEHGTGPSGRTLKEHGTGPSGRKLKLIQYAKYHLAENTAPA